MADVVVAVLIFSVLPLALAFAALSDLWTMTIPNFISAVAIVAFLLLAPLSGLAWPVIGMSLAAALLVFIVCFGLFAFRIMGGGDAKLLTATALWFGYDPSLLVFLVTVAYVGGALTLIMLLLRTQANSAMAIGIRLPASLSTEKKIPYGIAIAIGGFMTLQQAPIFLAAMQTLR
ncbi:A24 family peptidase [Neorhizobium alkalisoli]|uniref:Prepilin peptidase CpaA n=1 Tax=Neorhizobium alkalisoli TaxID=528178 RepID=A0A561QRB1_9HYPH|nr:prepilin peptidase [Neorhizobium alkalisoli]TWF52935.1 prepilin peptidase CpaA [Neorhizobium alkalisoli]